MPFVNIKVAGPTFAPEQVRRLQQEATSLVASLLRKKPELTAVLVEQLAVSAWSIGTKQPSAAAHLVVTVTQGTNSPAEKARFVAEGMALLRAVLGSDLDPVAYVVVQDVPGEAWGWGGLTQAGRVREAEAA